MYYCGRKMARSRRGMRISENDGNARGRDFDKIPSVKVNSASSLSLSESQKDIVG